MGLRCCSADRLTPRSLKSCPKRTRLPAPAAVSTGLCLETDLPASRGLPLPAGSRASLEQPGSTARVQAPRDGACPRSLSESYRETLGLALPQAHAQIRCSNSSPLMNHNSWHRHLLTSNRHNKPNSANIKAPFTLPAVHPPTSQSHAAARAENRFPSLRLTRASVYRLINSLDPSLPLISEGSLVSQWRAPPYKRMAPGESS